MHTVLEQYGPLVARVLLASLFIVAGIQKAMGFDGTVGMMEGLGFPLPAVSAAILIALELGGGILVLLGWKTCLGAGALLFVSVVSAFVGHFDFPDQLGAFLKNMGLAGGYLLLMIHGAGPFSLDAKRKAIPTGEGTYKLD